MTPRQLAAIGASAATIALALSGAALLSGFGSPGIRNAATTTRGATSSSADAKTVRPPLSAAVTHAATLPLDLPRRVAAPPPVADVPVRDPAPPASAVGTAAVPTTNAATVIADPPKPAVVPAGETAVPRTETALPESGPP